MVDQNSTFGGFLTDVGEAKQANANALNTPWKLTHMVLGDADGNDPVPDAKQTSLINQVYRAPVNQLSVDPDNPGILIAELVLPPNVGGWWIRELGLEDEDGDFVAVANCAPSYKPLLAQGSGRNQVVRMHLILSNTANVQLKIDPSVVLATRQYVDKAIEAHAASRNHPDADTKNKGFTRFATLVESKKGEEAKAAQTPAGGMAQLDEHREEAAAHDAGKIALSEVLAGFVGAENVQAVLEMLGTAAVRGVGEENGQVMPVGAFGLGGAAGQVNDINSIQKTMAFKCGDTATGAPRLGYAWDAVGWHLQMEGGDCAQMIWVSAGSMLFTRIKDSEAESWTEWVEIYHSANIGKAFSAQRLSSNGYQILPGGMIMQWGSASSGGTENPGIESPFPIPFPNACLRVVATDNDDGTPQSVGIGWKNNKTVVVQCLDNGAVNYIAMGY